MDSSISLALRCGTTAGGWRGVFVMAGRLGEAGALVGTSQGEDTGFIIMVAGPDTEQGQVPPTLGAPILSQSCPSCWPWGGLGSGRARPGAQKTLNGGTTSPTGAPMLSPALGVLHCPLPRFSWPLYG